MRGAVEGLANAFPLGEQLPSVYAEDEMAQRFTGGLDDLLAPLLSTIDCFAAYLQPRLAPTDFVAWLGSWVGTELTGEEPEDVLRETVAGAAALHRWRGTARGIREAIRMRFGVTPEIVESGGAAWSSRPLGPFPGDPTPSLRIRLRVRDERAVNQRQLDEFVAAIRPAHVPCVIEIVSDGANEPADATGPWRPDDPSER